MSEERNSTSYTNFACGEGRRKGNKEKWKKTQEKLHRHKPKGTPRYPVCKHSGDVYKRQVYNPLLFFHLILY